MLKGLRVSSWEDKESCRNMMTTLPRHNHCHQITLLEVVNFIFRYISPQFKKHKETSLQEANSAVSPEQLFVSRSFQSLVKIHSAIPSTSKAMDTSNQRRAAQDWESKADGGAYW